MGRRAQCFQTRHSLHAPRLRHPAAPRRRLFRKAAEPPELPGAGRRRAEPLPADGLAGSRAPAPGTASAGRPQAGTEWRGYAETPAPATPTKLGGVAARGRAARCVRHSREARRRRRHSNRGGRWGGRSLCALGLAGLGRGVMGPQGDTSVPGGPAVAVAFPGAVCRGSGCRFTCELLKHVLHQRNQLPLPYEQLAFFCRRAAQVRGGGRGSAPGRGIGGSRGVWVLLASTCSRSGTRIATCRCF